MSVHDSVRSSKKNRSVEMKGWYRQNLLLCGILLCMVSLVGLVYAHGQYCGDSEGGCFPYWLDAINAENDSGLMAATADNQQDSVGNFIATMTACAASCGTDPIHGSEYNTAKTAANADLAACANPMAWGAANDGIAANFFASGDLTCDACGNFGLDCTPCNDASADYDFAEYYYNSAYTCYAFADMYADNALLDALDMFESGYLLFQSCSHDYDEWVE